MIAKTIARQEARQIYNVLGHDLDRAVRYEHRAKQLALRLLAPYAGASIFHAGVGTGAEHAFLQAAAGEQGLIVGYDLSRGMLELTRERAPTPLIEGDIGRLPCATHSFDLLFSAYLLDLIPTAELPAVLAEFRRIVRPGGRIVLVSLTEGIDRYSRAFVAVWKWRFRLNPRSLGGCRPLQLMSFAQGAGFRVERQVIVQRGFPSEVLVGS